MSYFFRGTAVSGLFSLQYREERTTYIGLLELDSHPDAGNEKCKGVGTWRRLHPLSHAANHGAPLSRLRLQHSGAFLDGVTRMTNTCDSPTWSI